MDPKRIELSTSALRTRRSPRLSYGPKRMFIKLSAAAAAVAIEAIVVAPVAIEAIVVAPSGSNEL